MLVTFYSLYMTLHKLVWIMLFNTRFDFKREYINLFYISHYTLPADTCKYSVFILLYQTRYTERHVVWSKGTANIYLLFFMRIAIFI